MAPSDDASSNEQSCTRIADYGLHAYVRIEKPIVCSAEALQRIRSSVQNMKEGDIIVAEVAKSINQILGASVVREEPEVNIHPKDGEKRYVPMDELVKIGEHPGSDTASSPAFVIATWAAMYVELLGFTVSKGAAGIHCTFGPHKVVGEMLNLQVAYLEKPGEEPTFRPPSLPSKDKKGNYIAGDSIDKGQTIWAQHKYRRFKNLTLAVSEKVANSRCLKDVIMDPSLQDGEQYLLLPELQRNGCEKAAKIPLDGECSWQDFLLGCGTDDSSMASFRRFFFGNTKASDISVQTKRHKVINQAVPAPLYPSAFMLGYVPPVASWSSEIDYHGFSRDGVGDDDSVDLRAWAKETGFHFHAVGCIHNYRPEGACHIPEQQIYDASGWWEAPTKAGATKFHSGDSCLFLVALKDYRDVAEEDETLKQTEPERKPRSLEQEEEGTDDEREKWQAPLPPPSEEVAPADPPLLLPSGPPPGLQDPGIALGSTVADNSPASAILPQFSSHAWTNYDVGSMSMYTPMPQSQSFLGMSDMSGMGAPMGGMGAMGYDCGWNFPAWQPCSDLARFLQMKFGSILPEAKPKLFEMAEDKRGRRLQVYRVSSKCPDKQRDRAMMVCHEITRDIFHATGHFTLAQAIASLQSKDRDGKDQALLIQKWMAAASDDDLNLVIEELRTNENEAKQLLYNEPGCFIVSQMLQEGTTRNTKTAQNVSEFMATAHSFRSLSPTDYEEKLFKGMKNKCANHAMKMWVQLLHDRERGSNDGHLQTILATMQRKLMQLVCDVHGVRSVNGALEMVLEHVEIWRHGVYEPRQVSAIIDTLSINATTTDIDFLIMHQFGNHTIQQILALKPAPIVDVICTDEAFVKYSKHGRANYVVQQAIKHADEADVVRLFNLFIKHKHTVMSSGSHAGAEEIKRALDIRLQTLKRTELAAILQDGAPMASTSRKRSNSTRRRLNRH